MLLPPFLSPFPMLVNDFDFMHLFFPGLLTQCSEGVYTFAGWFDFLSPSIGFVVFNSYFPEDDVTECQIESKRWHHGQSSSVDLCFHRKCPTEDVDCCIGCLVWDPLCVWSQTSVSHFKSCSLVNSLCLLETGIVYVGINHATFYRGAWLLLLLE